VRHRYGGNRTTSAQHRAWVWIAVSVAAVCRRIGRVAQFQVAVDGFPQLVFGVPAQAAVFPAPVVLPVGAVDLAQVAERRIQFTGDLVTAIVGRGFRAENGKFTESWHQEDVPGMLRQLGLEPPPVMMRLAARRSARRYRRHRAPAR